LVISIVGGYTNLSYHKYNSVHVDAADRFDLSNIRVLNLSDPTACVSLRFGCSVATSIDEWDGDSGSGHPLAALGIVKGHFYEVQDSEWLQHLQRIPHPEREGEHHRKLRHFVCAFRVNVVQIAATSLAFLEGEAPLQLAATSFSHPRPVPTREA